MGQDIPGLERHMVRIRLAGHTLSIGCFMGKAAKGCHLESVGRENQSAYVCVGLSLTQEAKQHFTMRESTSMIHEHIGQCAVGLGKKVEAAKASSILALRRNPAWCRNARKSNAIPG
jgi:hypothetical protein